MTDRLNVKIGEGLLPLSSLNVPKPLWEVFPDYTLSPNLNANEELIGTLKEVYAPKAVRIRDMFLSVARMQIKERAEAGDEQYPVNIEDDLFQSAGQAMEAHLRKCSLADLKLFNSRNDDLHPSLKFYAFFKPRAAFSTETWETMTALLAAVWNWADRWHLNHYAYVHLACLALLEGHWIIILDPFPYVPAPPPPLLIPSFLGGTLRVEKAQLAYPILIHPQDPREKDDFISQCTPGVGWHSAQWSLLSPSLIELDNSVPLPPKGFPPYRGIYRGAADQKAARKKYVEICELEAKKFIESSFLSSLGTVLCEKIIEEVRERAKLYSEEVDREYNRRRETMPGRYWQEYDRDIKWAVKQVIFRQDWQTIARASRTKADTVKKAVRKTLNALFLPYASVEREMRERKRGILDA